MSNNTIYVDSNEPDWVATILKEETTREKFDWTPEDVEIQQLKTGDIVSGNTCIERKSRTDFHSSIPDQRLKQQTTRMLKDFEHNYILFSGDLYKQDHSNLHDNSIAGTAASITAKRNIKMVPYNRPSTFAYTVLKILQLHREEEDGEILLKKTRADTEDTYTAMLTCITGISQDKALQIKKRLVYETIGGLAQEIHNNPDTVSEQLQQIDGIGPKLSQRIINELH